MDKEPLHLLKPDQLIQMLSIGIEDNSSKPAALGTDEQIGNYFYRLISRKIPRQSSIVDSILIFLRENQRYGDLAKGRSLSELLLDASCPIGLFEAVKETSKRICQTAISKGENAVAAAIYYAAIAAALIHCNTKISSHSWETLKTSFEDLLAKPWMTGPFSELLEKARQRCEKEAATQ